MTRRVVVTGVGLVCALGIGTEESWRNLVAGKSGIGHITHFDTTNFDCQIAGEVKNFDPFRWIEKKELKKMGRPVSAPPHALPTLSLELVSRLHVIETAVDAEWRERRILG